MMDKVKAVLLGIQGLIYGIWGYMIYSFFKLMGKDIKEVSNDYNEQGWVYFEKRLMAMSSEWMANEILIFNLILIGQVILVVIFGTWALVGLIPIAYVTYHVFKGDWNYAKNFLFEYTVCGDDNFDMEFLNRSMSHNPFSRNTILNYEHLIKSGSW
jgi:hypothetical protein